MDSVCDTRLKNIEFKRSSLADSKHCACANSYVKAVNFVKVVKEDCCMANKSEYLDKNDRVSLIKAYPSCVIND